MSNLSKALKYADMGIRVFPCKPKTKAPRPRNGYHEGTTNVEKISNWWKRHPDDLIGGVCDDTFTVIDVDCGGKCPQEQKDIILSVVDEMKDLGVIPESAPCVSTKSGGFHYYLAHTQEFTRKINYLPAIDLLAANGYVILPDSKTYKLISGKFGLTSLKPVNSDILEQLHDKYDDVRREVKYAIDVAKGKSPRKPSLSKNPDRRNRVIEKAEDIDMYQKSSDINNDINAEDSLLIDGKIHIDEGMLDSELINTLFFNQEIQAKLAKYIGLRVPSIKKSPTGRVKGSLQRSILVGHKDTSPSMGVRWAQVESHVLARDFSDHYGDGLCDYNVVRLYMNRMYGKNISRPSKAEWVTWFVRLLFEAGVIEIKKHLQFVPMMEELFQGHKKKVTASMSIFLLDAVKCLHSKYEGEFPVTKSFMAAWCNTVHKNTSYNTLKELVANGFLQHTSTTKLSEKRNLFLYKVNTDILKTDETIENTIETNEQTNDENMDTTMSDNIPLQDWLNDQKKDPTYKDIGELDKREADKVDWDDVEWDVYPESLNTTKPPT